MVLILNNLIGKRLLVIRRNHNPPKLFEVTVLEISPTKKYLKLFFHCDQTTEWKHIDYIANHEILNNDIVKELNNLLDLYKKDNEYYIEQNINNDIIQGKIDATEYIIKLFERFNLKNI